MAAIGPCVLVSHLTTTHLDYDTLVGYDQIPRYDYIELARRIGGVLPLHPLSKSLLYGQMRAFEHRLSIDLSMAVEIARRASRYNVIVSTSETIGIPLGFALRLIGSKTPQIVIGHKLSAGLQRRIWRYTGVQHSFAGVVAVSRAQAAYANSPEGMGLDKAHFIYDKVDQVFFRPLNLPDEGYVLAVGQEQRDYGTLAKALYGTGIKLVIVASSPWATVRVTPEQTMGITVLSNLPFPRLRELYAKARLVVIPTQGMDYAAGVNAVLEGMAMARPVITTRTLGLDGYVDHGTTGMLVPPADHLALRETILDLWDQPHRRATLGRSAREVVEARMNLDYYVGQLAQIVEATAVRSSTSVA